MALQKYTKEWLKELCENSYSYAEVLEKAGRKQSGGNQSYLKQKINQYHIDTSHFLGQGWRKGTHQHGHSKYSLEEILVTNSPVQRNILRRYLLKYQVLPYKCVWCGNTGEWFGKTLSLEIDHINGVNNDNRLENLRWLCPNCHATTSTYAGKNNYAGVPEQAYGSDLESEV